MTTSSLPNNVKIQIAVLAIKQFIHRRNNDWANYSCTRIRDATQAVVDCGIHTERQDLDMMKEYEYFTINRIGHTPEWWNKCNYEYQDERLACLQAYKDHLTSLEEQRMAVHGRCTYCDGTGDVHSPDGEWRGECNCTAPRKE